MSQQEFEEYPLFQSGVQKRPVPPEAPADEAGLWEVEEWKRWKKAGEKRSREEEEKARWIAQRKAQERRALLEKLLRKATLAVPLALIFAALILLGIPGYTAYRATLAQEAGDYVGAAASYRRAADWGLFNALFHPDRKAEELAAARQLASCTAGVSDGEIPRDAVRLSGTAQGMEGPITVEVIANSARIYRVAVTEHTEKDEVGGEAARQMPERIYRAQSVEVDAVTGATVSSQAICRAVSNALSSDKAWTAKIYPWRFGAITPMPSPSPTMGPPPQDVKIFDYENELEEFTAQVGETVRLRAVAYPESDYGDAAFRWTVSDARILKLSVSDSTRECVVLCLKHRPGTVTLTVDCNGVTRDILIYTRD